MMMRMMMNRSNTDPAGHELKNKIYRHSTGIEHVRPVQKENAEKRNFREA